MAKSARAFFNGTGPAVVRMVVLIISVIVAVATAWAVMNVTVSAHGSKLDLHDCDLEKLEARVRVVEEFRVEQRVHNRWTKETLIRIENKLGE